MLKFAKKADASVKTPAQEQPQSNESSSKPTMKFMKHGAAAQQALAEEEAKAELAKQERDKLWRFWMPPNEERQITFLDGEVDSDGMLAIGMYHEHQVKVNGNWENFVCTAETEGRCPICDKGDSKAYLVGVMTIIDHTPYKVQSGPNAGKVYKNARKLFVAKKQTIQYLTKLAIKRGGLTGCTFDATRGNDKTPSVGQQFDFVTKCSLETLASKLDMKIEEVQPADYQHEITYRSATDLDELGIGKAPSGPGYEKGSINKSKLASQM